MHPMFQTSTQIISGSVFGAAFVQEHHSEQAHSGYKARGMLHDKGQPTIVQEIIAKRIIDIASAGDPDPDALARRALLALGMNAE